MLLTFENDGVKRSFRQCIVMALDFQNYLYSSSPPDFELFKPPYLGRRRRSPPYIATRKFAASKDASTCVDSSFKQPQLQEYDASDDCLFEDYGFDVVGLTKCTDRSCAMSFSSLLTTGINRAKHHIMINNK